MKTGAPVTVEQLGIKTASIEVKILTVNNRKLTQAVFRQIPQGSEDIITDFLELNENIRLWGHVNYFWDKEYPEDEYYHFLYDKDGELFRTYENRFLTYDLAFWYSDKISELEQAIKAVSPTRYGTGEKEYKRLMTQLRQEQQKTIQTYNKIIEALTTKTQLFIAV